MRSAPHTPGSPSRLRLKALRRFHGLHPDFGGSALPAPARRRDLLRRRRLRFMLRTAPSLPLAGLLTPGSDPARFPAEPPACYRAWQLPGPDFHRQATTSLRTARSAATSQRHLPLCWAHERPGLVVFDKAVAFGGVAVNGKQAGIPQQGQALACCDGAGHRIAGAGGLAWTCLTCGFMRCGGGRTAAARSRSAGMSAGTGKSHGVPPRPILLTHPCSSSTWATCG